MEKKCQKCGEIFERRHNSQKYCWKCAEAIRNEKTKLPKFCKECGKLLEGEKNAQKFCGPECRYIYSQNIGNKAHYIKPFGWKHHGFCSHCGKEFESNHKKKFCDKKCQTQATREKAKEERAALKGDCIQCGKKLPLKRHCFCSDKCQHLAEKKTEIIWKPLTEDIIRHRIEERYSHIEYVSGCSTGKPITVRCKTCGGEYEVNEQCSRKPKKIPCPYCIESDNASKKEAFEQCKLIISLIDILERRKKLLDGIERRKRCCAICGKEFVSYNGSLMCGPECRKRNRKKYKNIRKIRVRCNGYIDSSISLDRLIKRDKNTCHICGGRCDKRDYSLDENINFIVGPKYPSIDHVQPLSRGGSHTWDNVKLAHCICNSIKSDHKCYERTNGQMALAI